jgi:hypothetical protein
MVKALNRYLTRFPHIIMTKLDYEALIATVRRFCERCEGSTWQQVAARVGLLGRWEFDDYRE